jgi:hypothetical protein
MNDECTHSNAHTRNTYTPRAPRAFACSASFGVAINYTIVWCTSVNSALTTTVVGCLKNLVVAYVGILVGGDYIFSWLNFTGITVSVTGALMYSVIEFRQKAQAAAAAARASSDAAAGAELVTQSAGKDGGGGGSDGTKSGRGGEISSAYRDDGDDDDDDDEDNFSDEEAAFLAEVGPEEGGAPDHA